MAHVSLSIVEEARGELGLVTNIAAIKRTMITDLDAAQKLMDERIDAYGDARELKGHVRACGESWPHVSNPAYNRLQAEGKQTPCGTENWYCDKAKAIKQLGGSQ